MAEIIKGIFGTQPEADIDEDFADYAGAPNPTPGSLTVSKIVATPTSIPGQATPYVYTKWYRIWERAGPKDFMAEAIILPFMLVVLGLHIWGRRANKAKANAWITVYAPRLQKEYSQVGFESRTNGGSDAAEELPLLLLPEQLLKEKSAQEFLSYATGRQNVAFTDVRLALYKRHNPATWVFEAIASSIFASVQEPTECAFLTSYPFDGRENELVSAGNGRAVVTDVIGKHNSSYDAFVWAVVHKDEMKRLRDDRYDLSLTATKDHASLPAWAAVMSESAELTNTLLTADLIKAIELAGENFRYLIVSDQPLTKPNSVGEAKPKKRLSLCLRLPSESSGKAHESSFPVFDTFLRFPDQLVSRAHFRPEVNRKIKAIRDEEVKKLIKLDDDEKAEERRLENEKKKKEARDSKVRGMTADEQRKFLEKEKERSGKKEQKKMARKA